MEVLRDGAMIDVCQLTTALWEGGIEERMARVIGALDRRRFRPSWLALGDRANPSLLSRAGGDFPWAIFERSRAGLDPSLIARLARALERLRPDVLHVHNWSTGLYGLLAARRAGVPRVIFGLGGRDQPVGPSRRQRALAHALSPLVDRFTTVCEFLADELAETWGVARRRITVIPTGIERPVELASSREAKARFDIPAEAVVLGTTAVDRPVKRLADFFEAAIEVARADARVHLLWVGDADGSSLDRRARAAGVQARCHAVGRVEDARRFARANDVFVNCSDFEGSSNAILEALAADVAVVASAVGGTPELVQHGRTGLLVPPRSPERLARALRELVQAPRYRRALGAAGGRYVRAHHTVSRMVDGYVDLYREVGSFHA